MPRSASWERSVASQRPNSTRAWQYVVMTIAYPNARTAPGACRFSAGHVGAEPDHRVVTEVAGAPADADALEGGRHERRAVGRRVHPPAHDARGLLGRAAVADPADGLADGARVHPRAQAGQARLAVGIAVRQGPAGHHGRALRAAGLVEAIVDRHRVQAVLAPERVDALRDLERY